MNTTATLKPNTVPGPVALKARGRLIPLNAGPLIMGVLNVTPDSFSDGGRYLDPGAAVDHAGGSAVGVTGPSSPEARGAARPFARRRKRRA